LRKVAIILVLGIIAVGCSLTRMAENVSAPVSGETESDNIVENVTRQNLTSGGFFIQKAEIEFINLNGKQKFLATVKFEYPDKFLISLKSKTGI
jgi:hypothetical protein